MKRSRSNSPRILALSAMAVAAGVSLCLTASASAAMNAADNASNYTSGTWGPPSAEALIAQDGRRWLEPIFTEAPASGG